MCNERNKRLRFTGRIYKFKRSVIRIDECMATFILNLNLIGVKTLACCCGHGKYPMSVVVDEGNHKLELFSGACLFKKKNFYKKDKQGYYYIPEALTST